MKWLSREPADIPSLWKKFGDNSPTDGSYPQHAAWSAHRTYVRPAIERMFDPSNKCSPNVCSPGLYTVASVTTSNESNVCSTQGSNVCSPNVCSTVPPPARHVGAITRLRCPLPACLRRPCVALRPASPCVALRPSSPFALRPACRPSPCVSPFALRVALRAPPPAPCVALCGPAPA